VFSCINGVLGQVFIAAHKLVYITIIDILHVVLLVFCVFFFAPMSLTYLAFSLGGVSFLVCVLLILAVKRLCVLDLARLALLMLPAMCSVLCAVIIVEMFVKPDFPSIFALLLSLACFGGLFLTSFVGLFLSLSLSIPEFQDLLSKLHALSFWRLKGSKY